MTSHDIANPPPPAQDADIPLWTPAADTSGVPAPGPETPAEQPQTGHPRIDHAQTGHPQAGHQPIEHDTTYQLPAGALRNALFAVVVVVAGSVAAAFTVSRLAEHVRANSLPEFLLNVASLIVGDGIVFATLHHFATRRGVRTRDLGLTTPVDKSQAAVLAVAAWMMFMFGAATWVSATTPADQLRAQETTNRDRTPIVIPDRSPDPASVDSDDVLSDDGTNDGTNDGTDAGGRAVASPNETNTAPDNRHALIKVLQDDPPLRIVILIVVAACLLAPLVEELFFRGYLFSVVASRFGPTAAALSTGALFGLAHASVVPLRIVPVLGLLGVSLGWLRHRTSSIVPGIAVHAFVNSLATGISAGFGVSTVALILGSWAVLLALTFPLLRRNARAAFPAVGAAIGLGA